MGRLAKYYAGYFGIVDLQDGTARLREKGVKRVLKIGFALGFVTVNLLTYYVFGPSGAEFIIPTGLSTTRLVFTVFLLYFFLVRMDVDSIQELDQKYGWDFVYDEERDGHKVEHKW